MRLESVTSLMDTETLRLIPAGRKGLSVIVAGTQGLPAYRDPDSGDLVIWDEKSRRCLSFGAANLAQNFGEVENIVSEISDSPSEYTRFERSSGLLRTDTEVFGNERIRRELKHFSEIEIKESTYSPGSREWNRVLSFIGKFLALKGQFVDFPAVIRAHSSSAALAHLRVGSLFVDDSEILFATTEFEDVLCADYCFPLPENRRGPSLTTAFHGHMLRRAKALGIPSYSLGAVRAPDLPGYDGVETYKRQWKIEEHPYLVHYRSSQFKK